MSVSSNPSGAGTILDRLMEDDEILRAMLSMPREMNEDMVESRREELFEGLWAETGLEKAFVLEHAREREDDFIEVYSEYTEAEGGDMPTWLLRMEAQDTILELLAEEIGVSEQ